MRMTPDNSKHGGFRTARELRKLDQQDDDQEEPAVVDADILLEEFGLDAEDVLENSTDGGDR